MRRAIPLLLVLFLAACAQHEDLPPPPPLPGAHGMIGQAIGGVQLQAGKLPTWAAPIQHTDITPHILKEGEIVKVTVERPTNLRTAFYAFGFMYIFNDKAGVWERVPAVAGESGTVSGDWVKDEAVFRFRADKNKFDYGMNYLITYWCIDTEEKDERDQRIWLCNGNKWGLGAFEVLRRGFPAFLIEEDIARNRFNISTKTTIADGVQYEAVYHGPSSVDFARVLLLNDEDSFKDDLASNIALLRALYTTRGGACGFYQEGARTFSWLSDNTRIAVVSPDVELVRAYADRYPSDCNLLEELERIAEGLQGFCGNGLVEAPEQCDFSNDTACPGGCKPDCTCSVVGSASSGTCGDLIIQRPNSQGVVETCEPPEVRDPVTGQVLSGSACFVRDPSTNEITEEGHCDHTCACVFGPSAALPSCGDGFCAANETASNCPADCLLDTSVPNLTINSPASLQVYNSTLVRFNVSASDNLGVGACNVRLGSVSDALVKSSQDNNWYLSRLLRNGSYLANVSCTDLSGNTNYSSVRFFVNVSVDLQGPSISDIRPVEGAVFDSNTVNYELVASDSSGVTSCIAITDGFGNQMSMSQGRWILAKTLPEGNHSVVFECRDTPDNKANATRAFSIVLHQAVNLTDGDSVGAKVVDVDIQGFKFEPRDITINAGDTVRWTNKDGVGHTAMGQNNEFDTGTIQPGQAVSYKFNTTGTYNYRCGFHPSMTGSITVQ